jgi:starvation-inducible DNA-binding protein
MVPPVTGPEIDGRQGQSAETALADEGLKKEISMSADQRLMLRNEELGTPTDLASDAVTEISEALKALLADVFALYLKTKNFHWHMSGPHFRDYHLLLDEQSDQIFAMSDPIAERGRKIGGSTIHSIGEIKRLQRLLDNDEAYVTPRDMLAELHGDNKQLVSEMRRTHELCEQYNDVATASLLEVWIDETERRAWFLYESTRTTEG